MAHDYTNCNNIEFNYTPFQKFFCSTFHFCYFILSKREMSLETIRFFSLNDQRTLSERFGTNLLKLVQKRMVNEKSSKAIKLMIRANCFII